MEINGVKPQVNVINKEETAKAQLHADQAKKLKQMDELSKALAGKKTEALEKTTVEYGETIPKDLKVENGKTEPPAGKGVHKFEVKS